MGDFHESEYLCKTRCLEILEHNYILMFSATRINSRFASKHGLELKI